MNPSTHDERRGESPAVDRGQPPVRPPLQEWGPIQEVNPSFWGAVLSFLRSLNGPTLVAVLAIAGIVYIGAPLARPEREMPTPGVVGACVSVGSLAVIALMALRAEGENRHGKNRKNRRHEPTNA